MANILLFDEQTDSRELLKRVLELAGHDVFTEKDEAGAVTLVTEKAPDLTVVNVQSGLRSGLAVCERFRAERPAMKLLIIADHATGRPPLVTNGAELILKPLELETFEAKVQELLGIAPRQAEI